MQKTVLDPLRSATKPHDVNSAAMRACYWSVIGFRIDMIDILRLVNMRHDVFRKIHQIRNLVHRSLS